MIKEAERSTALIYYYAKGRDYRRQHKLRLRGRVIRGVNKAPYPENGGCPCCGGTERRLQWHHWADENYNNGLWMCTKCHFMLEGVLRQMRLIAKGLRKSLEKGFSSTIK